MNFKSLLVEKGKISIPAIGHFTLKYRSAYIDHIENKIYPPAKVVIFDLDDKISKDQVSNEEIEWSAILLEACELKGQASIKDIGTLKKVNNFWVFISLEANLDDKFQGLPNVEAQPLTNDSHVSEIKVGESNSVILSDESIPDVNMTESEVSDISEDIYDEQKENDFQGEATNELIEEKQKSSLGLFLAMGAALFFIAIFLFNNFKNKSNKNNSINVSHVNEKPKEEDAIWDTSENNEEVVLNTEKDSISHEIDAIIAEEMIQMSKEIDGKEKTAETAVNDSKEEVIHDIVIDNKEEKTSIIEKQAIVIIGAFKNKGNINELINEINKLGYDVYRDEIKNLSRLGFYFTYDNLKDLTITIEKASDKFNVEAWILKK